MLHKLVQWNRLDYKDIQVLAYDDAKNKTLIKTEWIQMVTKDI